MVDAVDTRGGKQDASCLNGLDGYRGSKSRKHVSSAVGKANVPLRFDGGTIGEEENPDVLLNDGPYRSVAIERLQLPVHTHGDWVNGRALLSASYINPSWPQFDDGRTTAGGRATRR